MNKSCYTKQTGSVLILALWTIALLTIFYMQMALGIRQKVKLVSRLEDRSQLRYIAEAGVKKAIAALRFDLERNDYNYSAQAKAWRHHNSDVFSHIKLGTGEATILYESFESGLHNPVTRHGLVDEESKLNINAASEPELKRLIERVVTAKSNEAQELADAIIHWREDSASSDEQAKHFLFETMDEMGLVKGVTPRIFKKLFFFTTVYGDGQVNINTASPQVLQALGLDRILVDKFIRLRRGADGVENTGDDHIFYKTFDVTREMFNTIELTALEVTQLDNLIASGKIKTNSSFFLIHSLGRLNKGQEVLNVFCVYNSVENRIEYWRENAGVQSKS